MNCLFIVIHTAWLVMLVPLRLHQVAACSGRNMLNATRGVITDGLGKYPASANCEWLIDAGGPGKFISLTFVSMKTECSYDYLFVYDGQSYSAPLLASFSGSTLPDQVLAKSGHMLIHFYSDRNYRLQGFYALYNITDCPYNCSGHGGCKPATHRCDCNPGYRGEGCEVVVCPDNCNGHGICNNSLETCVCEAGFAGHSCQLPTTASAAEGRWYQLAPEGSGFQPRTGHIGVFIASVQCLYVFGGNTLNSLLDELSRYCFDKNTWQVVPHSEPWPQPRHEHAVAETDGNFFIFGGILDNNTHSDELWFYNVTNSRWTLMASGSTVRPLGVASHTLTFVDGRWLYLFGGRTTNGHFLSDMYRIDYRNATEWERVEPRGGKIADRRLVGHSAVYHPSSLSIIVFGGFLPDYAKFPKRTNFLNAYHIAENYWSRLYFHELDAPKDRAFHGAAIMGNYMVIHGGNAHIHHEEEICYDHQIYFYHLGCHTWVHYNTQSVGTMSTGYTSGIAKGRFSHVAVPAFGNSLLVVGGYRGNVLGDLLAFMVPQAVARNQKDSFQPPDADYCVQYKDKDSCKFNPECIWCAELPEVTTEGCMHRSRAQTCTNVDYDNSCPGICATLHDCGSCTVQGQGAVNTSLTTMWLNEKCAWCVKEAQCQKITEMAGMCDLTRSTQVFGYWGKNSSRLTSIDQCSVEDFPAGLHFIKYRYPPNWLYPDEVEIIRKSGANFQFDALFDMENVLGGKYVAKVKGFLHPLGAPSGDADNLQVHLVVVSAKCKLYISRDDMPANKELVAELNSAIYNNMLAERQDGTPIFRDESRDHKYYMEQAATQLTVGPGKTAIKSTMQIEWNGSLPSNSHRRHMFTAEFLEPYSGDGVCVNYTNCLMCLTDLSCGWCPSSGQCVQRVTSEPTDHGPCAASASQVHHLVVNTAECSLCADHIECASCASDPLCEWLTSEARCLRRGRFDESVRDAGQCPPPCQQRTNCSWCVGEQSECAWCEKTRTCFPFIEYVLRFSYGRCTQWIDSMSTQEACHDCTQHATCAACLDDYECGWCGNRDNPTIGLCLTGDFQGVESSSNCSALVAGIYNISIDEPADWSYGMCPDVEECRLGIHDCHANATCHNTPTSFNCICNRGFTGDGRSRCDRTCYYNCVHGYCSGAPTFLCICDIGWTGVDCAVDCGCHNHSTCVNGSGQCDKCEHWTTGSKCEMCQPGSFGDAASSQNCTPCECNDHEDESLGFCNDTTGRCYCQDNTQGDHCEICQDGYYGNPINGSLCFLNCEGRTILGSITSGALGSYKGSGVTSKSHAYCLWILTVHPDLTNLQLLDVTPSITFTMHTDIKTLCSWDFVYVYDGIPGFMTSESVSRATLLAAYCGYGLEAPRSVEAYSGYLTIYFEGDVGPSSSSRGFNASYHVNRCPYHCHSNSTCVGNRCVCQEGYGGVTCHTLLCPNNCSSHVAQGVCNQTLGQCVCNEGYGGEDCNKTVRPDAASFQPVYDPWRMLGAGAFNSSLARAGHSLVTCDGNLVYMFGGYSLSHDILNDLWCYNIATNQWTLLKPANEEEPSARYQHAAVCVPTLHAMYVFGGLGTSGAVAEMWKYNLDSSRWSKLQIAELEEWPVPPMAGHTMTLVDSTRVWIVGGFSTASYYSEVTYEYDTSNNKWQHLELNGSKPTGMYGHSAVYHKHSNAIYVFGGYEYQTDKNVPSSNLYTIDISRKQWNVLPPEPNNKPPARYFHAAVSTDQYMVVLGGWTRQHDFDSSVTIYRYWCNRWMNISLSDAKVFGNGIPAVVGGAAIVSQSGDIYFVAGFNSLSHGTVTRLSLPTDLCRLQTNTNNCLNQSGCAVCIDNSNATYCYTIDAALPIECRESNTAVTVLQGAQCDAPRMQRHDCTQRPTCSECLAEWPVLDLHTKPCQWCSNCLHGKCISIADKCAKVNRCSRQQRVIKELNNCVERLCQASDCDKCKVQKQKNPCIWTRQFKRSSEIGRTLSLIPIYNWNCVTRSLLDATPYKIESSPPNACPMRCYQYTTCGACLSSLGGEGGAQECLWSVLMQQCLPLAAIQLLCASGKCGHILSGTDERCPQPCSIHDQCSKCLATPGCGWCAYPGLNGWGRCMKGGLRGPVKGVCSASGVSLEGETLSEQAANWSVLATGAPHWAFTKCPPENECLNMHHTCDSNEDCSDLEVGFRCVCKTGYIRDKTADSCHPVCHQGCEPFGSCIAPEVCQCNFSYVGHNCSTECQCNKHSDCRSVEEPNVCLQCRHHTQGKQCDKCKPLYIGNPENGGTCQSCSEFCHHHATVCLTRTQYNISIGQPNLPLDPGNVTVWIREGPRDRSQAVCMQCGNNTQNEQCSECKRGFFRLAQTSLTEPCQPCQCQGHSDYCDKTTGINCDCHNNTKSPHCDATGQVPCYAKQCIECVENFLGTPTAGHHCYRQMSVDRDYCFDPTTQMQCDSRAQLPHPLPRGRTVFFAVQPKYLNVDIRITLDVTVGGVDVYFSPLDDTYKVDTDHWLGIHNVTIDHKYMKNMRRRRSIDMYKRHRRDADATASNTTTFVNRVVTAVDMNTYVTVGEPHTFLVVRRVRHRLVITLPNKVHNLKELRFYVILYGVGSNVQNNTFGNLFFRQDQPHIDLFVFFSVFFSCFFLFLAICVVLWKAKQAYDSHQSRHQRKLEMKHMASRPFARVLVVIDPPTNFELPHGTVPSPRLTRRSRMLWLPSRAANLGSPTDNSQFHVNPLTLEPTDDGVAVIGTMFVQLPGDSSLTVRACLGSTLMTMRVLYPTMHLFPKTTLRHNTNSSVA